MARLETLGYFQIKDCVVLDDAEQSVYADEFIAFVFLAPYARDGRFASYAFLGRFTRPSSISFATRPALRAVNVVKVRLFML